MKWLAIIAFMIAAFGPILWLMPKPRDRRLSRLRMAARQRGLTVELARLPDPQPRPQDRVSSGGALRTPVIRCAGYRLFRNRPAQHIEPWRLERGDSSAQAKLSAYWSDVPPDWLAIEVDANGACLYWREEVSDENLDERLDAVAGVLASILAQHRQSDELGRQIVQDS